MSDPKPQLAFSTRNVDGWIHVFCWVPPNEATKVDLGRLRTKLFEDSPGSFDRFSDLLSQMSADAVKALTGEYPEAMEERRLPPEDLMLRKLQDEQRPWVLHNFGDRPSWQPLMGAMEELGELCHAHLKQAQGIRTNDDHEAMAKDAVADIVIFLADYCTARGFDMEALVQETWDRVKLRDWKANPATSVAETKAAEGLTYSTGGA